MPAVWTQLEILPVPAACVRCGGNHNNRAGAKSLDTKPRCGLWGGTHPEKYCDCPDYMEIAKKSTSNPPKHSTKVNLPTTNTTCPDRSFVNVISNRKLIDSNDAPQSQLDHRHQNL